MESYNKLVRDKIPEILDTKGVSYEKRIASLEEYKTELIKKLAEEEGTRQGYSASQTCRVTIYISSTRPRAGILEFWKKRAKSNKSARRGGGFRI